MAVRSRRWVDKMVAVRPGRGVRRPVRVGGSWRGAAARSAVAAGVAALVIAPSSPALAHAALKSMSPADGSTVRSSPADVVLTFNEPVDGRFTAVKVTDPGGTAVSSGKPQVTDEVVTQRLAPLGVPGRYTVAFRTVSVDGHLVSGRRTFTFAPGTSGAAGTGPASPSTSPISGTPAEPSTATQAASQAGPSDPTAQASSGSVWPAALTLGIVGLALAVAVGLVVRRSAHGG